MKFGSENWKRLAAVALIVALGGVGSVSAQGQNRGGGFGGFGGFGGNRNNGGASSAASSAYNNNGTVGSAIISVDPQTHNLVVIADDDTTMQISNVLRRLDAPKPQVLIKVVFVEVQKTDDSQIGIEGGWANNGADGLGSTAGNVLGLSGLNTVVTNFNALGQPISSSLSPGNAAAGSGGFYQIVGSQYQATVRAIAKGGKAQVLSKPSILARDGQLAKIVVGQQVPLPSGVSYTQSGNSTVPIVDVTYTDVGIILNVTPFIGENGLVQMIIQPQISSVSTTERQQLSADVSAPYLNVRSADTVVVTPDAQTVVIGGLISDNKSASETKVPFLGDIPLLGNLFKTKTKAQGKTELLIFLTPYIVEAPTQLAAMSSRESRGSQLITNLVSSQDLERYLDTLPVKKEK